MNQSIDNTYIESILVILSITGLIYSIWLYFDTYNSPFVSIKATILNVNCVREIINKRKDEYHCRLWLKYVYNKRILQNELNLVGPVRYYEGDEVLIQINKDNLNDIKSQSISQEITALCIAFMSSILLIGIIANYFIPDMKSRKIKIY